jgi:hypothetical protein
MKTADPTALLRAVNPIPPTRVERLRAELEAAGGAEQVISRESRDVARPARRRPSLRLVVAVAVLICVAFLVAPAIGIPLPALPFFAGDSAPAPVVKDFASLGVGAPPGMDPGVLADQTRKVTTVHARDGAHTLWVAPTAQGGLCLEWTHESGGCDKLGTVPLSTTWATSGPASARRGGAPTPSLQAVTRVVGFVHHKYAVTVEIRFQDGDTVRPALVWVSPPIDAGFFFYDVPEAKQRPGHGVTSVVALDAEGRVVTQESLVPGPATRAVSADAIVSQKEAIARLETARGDAVAWRAPTRYGGRCWWLEFEGGRLPLGPCLPNRSPVQGLSVRLLATRDDVLVVGLTSARSLELVYADGDRSEIPVREGVVLFEIPSAHLEPGHEASQLRVSGRSSMPPIDLKRSPVSPCSGPLPVRGATGPGCLDQQR